MIKQLIKGTSTPPSFSHGCQKVKTCLVIAEN